MPSSHLPKVYIVGGGFAGLAAAKAMAAAPVDMTLVDRRNHHVFQPLLYQVATASLSPADISSPIRTILRDQFNCQVALSEAIGLEPEPRFAPKRRSTAALQDAIALSGNQSVPYA